ncbi:hypothetical protein JD276_06580 [Leucobacter sp. CSA1]|uniref:Uncharacterized protein n=1 Tax=Leucobacter chromiisoli TaxID=2796471 RepID=A0A934UUD3_9MICO|nr:hypothetical protein [Leucobacter chromiisoli]MBK0418700.1 hypothetical protein [Leucobacter chromiisoli]
MTRRSKTALIVVLALIGLLALVGGGGALVLSTMNQSRDPAAAVEEYLFHLEQGEAERASRLVDPGLSKTERALLADDVLGGAIERIEVESVETVSRDGDGARVRASMRLGDERFEHTFDVEHGPKELLFLDTWVLEEPLLAEVGVELAVPSGSPDLGAATIALGGADLGVSETGAATAHVYPGVYEVSAEAGEYAQIVVDGETVTALPEETARVEATVEPSAALGEAILTQVQDLADRCVTVITNMEPECPSLVQNTRLDEMTVTHRAAGFEHLDFTRFSTEEMEFGVRDVPSGSGSSAELRTRSYSLEGWIEWEDGEPRMVDPWFSGR